MTSKTMRHRHRVHHRVHHGAGSKTMWGSGRRRRVGRPRKHRMVGRGLIRHRILPGLRNLWHKIY